MFKDDVSGDSKTTKLLSIERICCLSRYWTPGIESEVTIIYHQD